MKNTRVEIQRRVDESNRPLSLRDTLVDDTGDNGSENLCAYKERLSACCEVFRQLLCIHTCTGAINVGTVSIDNSNNVLTIGRDIRIRSAKTVINSAVFAKAVVSRVIGVRWVVVLEVALWMLAMPETVSKGKGSYVSTASCW